MPEPSNNMPIGTGTALAIGLGGSLLSGLFGTWSSNRAAKKQLQAVRETNAANAELAKQQNDWNVQQWEREAAWQDTANQMQMWKNAGLNPNFYNGGTTAPTTQSADLANQVAPNVADAYLGVGNSIQRSFDQALNAFGQIYQTKKLEAETNNLNEQNEVIKQQAKLLAEQTRSEQTKQGVDNKLVEFYTKQISALDTQMNLWNAQANSFDASANESRLRMRMLKETWSEQKLAYKLQNFLTSSQINLNKQQISSLAQSLKTEVFNTAIKANEFQMTEFMNWLTKSKGVIEVLKGMNDQEKQSFTSSMFQMMNSLLDSSEWESDASAASKKVNQRNNYKSWLQSTLNPPGM